MLLDFEENTKKLKKHNPKSTLTPRKSESELLCEYCKKSFAPEKILKHIGHVKACKTFYGPRFDELKKEQQRKRIEKFNSNLLDKQQQNILKRNRERYAKSSEKKQKNMNMLKRENKKNLTRFKQNILRCKKKMEKKSICLISLKE